MNLKRNSARIIEPFKKINLKWEIIRNESFMKGILNFCPKNILIFLLMICSFVIIFNEYNSNNNNVIYRKNHQYTSNVGSIYKEPIKFNLYREGVDQDFDILSIRFATYERKNNSDYTIQIRSNDRVVYKSDFNTKSFLDNEYHDFYLNSKIDSSKLKDYTVEIIPVKTDTSNNITVFCNDNNGDVAVAYKVSKNIINTSTFIILGLVVIFFSLIKIINKNNIAHQKFFLFAFVFIVFATILTPPYQVPDERIHYLRTLQLSQYDFSQSPAENLGNKKITVPNNLDDVNYSEAEATDAVSDLGLIEDSIIEGKNVRRQYNSGIGGSAVMVAYLVPATVLRIVDYFTNSPLILFYNGRLVCLGINFILAYFAIKITPKFKNTMLLVALMPMSIQSMISYSYDGLLNACVLLFVAVCLKLICDNEDNIRKKYLVLSLALLFMIISIKLPYALLGILYFFIPASKFNGGIKKIFGISLMLIVTYLSTVLISKVGNIGLVSISEASNATSGESSNLTYLLNNPLEIFKIAKNTFKEKMFFYIESLVGYFGYFSIKMSSIFQYAYLFMAGGLILTEESPLKRKEKIIYMLTLLVIIGGIFGALYLAWSGYQLPYVEGVQGRYFIPLIIPAIMVLSLKKKIFNMDSSTVYSFINIILLHYVVLLLVYNF